MAPPSPLLACALLAAAGLVQSCAGAGARDDANTLLQQPLNFKASGKETSFVELDGPEDDTLPNESFAAEEMLSLQDCEVPLGKRKPRIAIFVPGIQDRFLLSSKLLNVIIPLFEQGYAVDVFIHLVASSYQNGAVNIPIAGSTPGKYVNVTSLCELLQAKIKYVANLAHCRLLEHNDDVSEQVKIAIDSGLTRFRGYNLQTRTGRNVVRRFLALQHLMEVSTSSGEYDHYLVTRDDSYWFAPLNMSALPNTSSPNNVYFTNCLGWGGVNDRVFLFGRESAKKVLLNVFTDFLMKDPRLATDNAESYWKAYLEIKGTTLRGVPFDLLQSAIGTYRLQDSSTVLCIKNQYLCSYQVISPKTPQVC
mmetsp:Transcript_98186/g.278011  ORF Transcript_98186/g.278011 Transcript_98186/m.278011 type:complete len:364 (-) Transcript_98186:55-1146(-)